MAHEFQADGVYCALTHDVLDPLSIMDKVRSPKAGAIVLFAGTTRDNFADKPVLHLSYESYGPLALRTLSAIAQEVKRDHGLNGIAMIHRLGVVPIGEESILIAVSAPHRHPAWHAGEEALELVKEKAEVWKREEFGGEEGGVWRANRDGQAGVKVADSIEKPQRMSSVSSRYTTAPTRMSSISSQDMFTRNGRGRMTSVSSTGVAGGRPEQPSHSDSYDGAHNIAGGREGSPGDGDEDIIMNVDLPNGTSIEAHGRPGPAPVQGTPTHSLSSTGVAGGRPGFPKFDNSFDGVPEV